METVLKVAAASKDNIIATRPSSVGQLQTSRRGEA